MPKYTCKNIDSFKGVWKQLVNSIYQRFSPSEKQVTQRFFPKLVVIAGITFTLVTVASETRVLALIFQQQKGQKKSLISFSQTVESPLLARSQFNLVKKDFKCKKEVNENKCKKEENENKFWEKHITLQGTDVKFSPNNKLVATIKDNIVCLWDVDTGKLLQELRGHQSDVTDVVFSPDGKQLATASNDNTARLWDVRLGKLLHELQGYPNQPRIYSKIIDVEFSPDGKLLATASNFGNAQLWDVKTGKQLQELRHPYKGFSVKFSPDSNRLASPSWEGTILLWDVNTGNVLEEKDDAGLGNDNFEHGQVVYSVEFSPDGRSLVSPIGLTVANWSGYASGYNAFNRAKPSFVYNHGDFVNNIKFSPDGRLLATASNSSVQLWDRAGKLLQKFIAYRRGALSDAAPIAFNPSSTVLATTSYNSVKMWNTKDGQLLREFSALYDEYNDATLAFSPDGKLFAIASRETKTVQLWQKYSKY